MRGLPGDRCHTCDPIGTGLRFSCDDERHAHHRRQLSAADAEPVRTGVLRQPVRGVRDRARTGPGAPQPDRRVGAVPVRGRLPSVARSAPVGRGTAREPAAADDPRRPPGSRFVPRAARQPHDAQSRPARPPPPAPVGVEGVHAADDRRAASARAAARRRVPRRRRSARHRRDGRHRRSRVPPPVHDHLGDARHSRRRRSRAAARVVGRDREGVRPDPEPRRDARDGRRQRRALEPRERSRRVEAREPGRRPAHRR